MLNLFPIQFLALFAYTILRVAVGFVLLYLGFAHFKSRHTLKVRFSLTYFPFGLFFVWYLVFFEILSGILFVLGLYTQIAALLTIFLSLKFLVLYRFFRGETVPGRLFYFLLLSASLSLLITGAGFFAVDLPL